MTRGRLRAVRAGLFIAAAMPPWGWWPLAILGLASWYRQIEDLGPRARFARSFLIASAWAFPGTLWMFDLTAPGWPVAALVFSFFMAAAGWATPATGPQRRIAFPAALAIAELVRWNWPFGGVPLATLAMAGVSMPFAMSARLFGAAFLAALVAVAAVLVGERGKGLRVTVALLAVLIGGTIGGHLAGRSVSAVDQVDVAVVQGGGPQNTRADICTTRAVFERHMAASETIDRPVDLVLWPEDVVHPVSDSAITPSRCDAPLLARSEAARRLTDLARDLDAVVISGWFEPSEDGRANTNYSMAQSPDGTITDRYDKVQLVPFGEFVPLRGLIERFSGELPARDVRAGTEPAVIDTPLGPFGVAISWEIFFDHRARDAIGNGGLALLNPTNGSSYWLTIVQSQQIASSRLRALETDRWVLQAAPTGFSAVIDPDADVRDRTGVSETRVLYDTIELRHGRTLAVAWGNWPVLIAALAVLSWPAGSALRRRLNGAHRPHDDELAVTST